MLGITSLALLDAVGLSLGLYIALVLRSVVFGDPVLWSLLWRTESEEWLPFLIPITLLVFWQAGLYATRERRAGLGRVASSLLLVALIVLAFGYGTGYDFNTTGLIPTALVVCAITIGLLRAAYDSLTLELQRLLHARKRALLLGTGESLATLRRMLSGKRAGIAYEFVDVLPPERDAELFERIAADTPRRGDPQRGRFRRGCRAGDRRDGAPRGREGADRAEDDRPAAPARRVRPRPGNAALRAAAARARRHGLGREEGVRPRRQRCRRPGRAAALAADRAGDQARLARARALPRPADRRRRARVRDAQVPDDGAGSGRAPGRARGPERGGGCALQDSRGPAR